MSGPVQSEGTALRGNPQSDVQLSVVVAPVVDGSFLPPCLEALQAQRDPPPMEVIVPVDESIRGVDSLRRAHPGVRFPHVAGTAALGMSKEIGLAHEAIDRRRAAGLSLAGAPIVALTDEQARPHPDWCARLVEAHQASPAVIGGAIENANDRLLNWALYFSDASRYQNPLPEGRARYVSDVNVSYKKEALDDVSDVWRHTYNEVAVHDAIRERGGTLWLRPDLIVYQDRGAMRLAYVLRERLAWARLYAGRRCARISAPKRLLLALASPLLGGLLLWRQATLAIRRGSHKRAFLRALPLLALMDLIRGVGELIGYVTGRATAGSA